jgi:hypothetical protein
MLLLALSGTAQAQCESLRVIVRNSVYPVIGLETFCTEFNKMKADLAGMRGELSIAREENDLLKARLAAVSGRQSPQPQALVGRDSFGDDPAR